MENLCGLSYPNKNLFDEVMVILHNNLNTFGANFPHLMSYFENILHNTKVLTNGFFFVLHDVIFPYEMNNIYVPSVNINNFLLDQYETFEYQNANSILVKQL